jgi:hypothetical protein
MAFAFICGRHRDEDLAVRYAWLIIAIFAARFLVVAVTYPAHDGDLGWQRWLGASVLNAHAIPRALGNETFSAPGAPWIPQEWLFGILAYLCSSGLAWDLFSAGIALCATATLVLGAYRASRRGASATAIAICTTFAGVMLLESFGVRAQVLAWPLLALFLVVLDREKPSIWLAALIAALWSNVHASATIAPVLAAAAAIGAALDERGFGTRARRLSLLALAAAVAICCNPFGWHLPAYALMLVTSPIKAYIREWKVTDLDQLSFAYGALPLLAIAAYAGVRGTRRWGDALLFALLVLMMLGAARNLALFGIVVAPIVAIALSRVVAFFSPARETPLAPPAAWLLPTTSLVVALGVAVALLRSGHRTEVLMPTTALHVLEQTPGEHRLLCGDFAWCSFEVGVPHVAVFLDGRADPYPPAIWDEFLSIARVQDGWREKLAARGVNTVLVARGSGLDQALERTPPWRSLFADKDYRLWVRPSAGVGLRALRRRDQAQWSRRELFSARGVLAGVPGVAGVGVIFGEPLEQTDVQSAIHLGPRRVPGLGELA